MVTIKDISKRSGFSVTTVSKALNNYPDISQKTKDKILALCDEMGYIPNISARSLVTQKSYTIGIIFEEITGLGLQHPLFAKILETFKSEVEKYGYDIMFLSKQIGTENGSYLQHSKRKQVEGIFILCAEFNNEEVVEVYKSDIPSTIIDYGFADITNITSNNKLGVTQAVKYLKSLGHSKIAHIHGSDETFIGGRRLDFFKEAMERYNLEVKDEYLVSGEFFSKEDGYIAMTNILNLQDPPTGIFCASDMLAIGAIQAITQSGKSVPEDFSIIGFDGIDIGQIFTPRLTTIKQDTEAMGLAAAHEMLEMIDQKQKHRKDISIDTKLVVGESTKELL